MPDYWEDADRRLHAESRTGLTAGPRGAAFPYRDPPPPALRERWMGKGVVLPPPLPLDYELGDVLAERESRREAKGCPAAALSTLLSLFRVRERVPGPLYESLRKLLPSGGGMHGLEAYAALSGSQGPSRGLYWYDPTAGDLVMVSAFTPEVVALLDGAARSAGVAHRPAVLIVLAARFSRWQWKYRGISYATILKDAGAAQMGLMLVASALGLNACPLGGGDSELFARATGLDPWAEGSVAEAAIW